MSGIDDPPPRTAGVARLVLIGAVGVFALSQTAVIPAVGTIADEFDTDIDAATWVLSAYLASAAVLTPLLGGLSDRFGRRRVLVIALAMFAAGAALAAVAPNLGVLVVARILQGAGGGILPVSFGIVREQLPASVQARAVASLSTVVGLGGGVGLLCGAWILDAVGYRTIFTAACGLAVLAAVCVLATIRTAPGSGGRGADVVEALLLALVIAGILLSLETLGSPSIRTTVVIAALPLAIGLLLLRARHVEAPVVDLKILGNPTVARANLAALLTGFAIFSLFVVVPHVATAGAAGASRDTVVAALVLLPGCMLQLPVGAAATRSAERSARPGGLLLPGCLLAAAGQAALVAGDGLVAVTVWTSVALGGLGIIFATLPNVLFQAVAIEHTGQASGLNSLVRMLGGAIGAQVSGLLIARSPDGVDHALLVSAAGCVIAGLLGSASVRRRR